MIEKPTNLREQLLNLMEGLSVYLKDRYTKQEVDDKFTTLTSPDGGGRVAQATNADKATEATHSSTTDTLKTPVEINGTFFDGSKSITTDKWGTKRTIFLKNGASTFEASIDGSSDIELEIPQLSSSEDTPGTLAVASSSEVA